MATKAKQEEAIVIRPLKVMNTTIRIEGDTPLIVHAWSDKAKQMMLGAQTGKADGKKKPPRRPADDFVQALYWLTPKPVYSDDATDDEIMAVFKEAIANGAKFGIPAAAIRHAAMRAWRSGGSVSKYAAFYIESDENGLVEIHGDSPVLREDRARIPTGAIYSLYRPQFNNWSIDLALHYRADGPFSLEDIVNALNNGGAVCGIGAWRPENGGPFGQFHVTQS